MHRPSRRPTSRSHRRSRWATPLLLAAILAIVAASCGDRAAGPGGDPDAIEHPDGPGDLVLRMDIAGGLLAAEQHLRSVPAFSLYGDGTLIQPGPQIEIYPGPALPALVATPISDEGIQAILDAAADAGLLDRGEHYDYPLIADAPTTTFTVVAGGGRRAVSVYALGEAGDAADLPEGEAAARAALADFQSKLFDLRSWLPAGSVGEERPYEAGALRLYVRPYRGAPDAALEQPPASWPLARSLSRFGRPADGLPETRCGVVEGTELGTLLPSVRASNELTPWQSGDASFQLIVRPLLPDESGC